MCVSNSTELSSAHTHKHIYNTPNAFEPTVNELCVWCMCAMCACSILPFAVLFSLCVSIFAFIYPDEFIPDCNCVQCLVSSVSESWCVLTLRVFRLFVRPFVQFHIIILIRIFSWDTSNLDFPAKNQTKELLGRYSIGQRNKKDTEAAAANTTDNYCEQILK